MAEQAEPKRFESFEDLTRASDETLRQVAARVHIVDLAYAFGVGDAALRERLLRAVRPGLADQIRSAMATVKHEEERFPGGEQVRSARARILQVVHDAMLDDQT